MKSKLAVGIVSVLLSAAVLVGCGGSAAKTVSSNANASSEKDLLARIREKGKITIAMEGTWVPWTYHDEDDDLMGYDVGVGQFIAEELGVKAEFIESEWDGLFEGLDAGLYDIIINGVDATPERNKKYDFSDPYAYIHTVLVVRDDNTEIKKFEDLKGKTTANSIGSTYMEMGEKFGAKVEGVDSLGETMQMVISRRVDATINAEVSVLDYLREQPDAPLEIVDATAEAGEVVIPLRKGEDSASLREAINAALKSMREDGRLEDLSEEYFGNDITKP